VPTLYSFTQVVNIQPGGSSSFTLANPGNCPAAYTVSSDGAPWLTFGPSDGTIAPSGTTPVNITVNDALLPPEEGTYSAAMSVVGPNNTITIQVKSTRGGEAPVILRPSGSCTGGTSTWSAFVTDDVAVASVTVTYKDADAATHSVPLSNNGNGVWNGTGGFAIAGSGYTVTATDFANHSSTLGFQPATSCT
jgi:hypothetical protein